MLKVQSMKSILLAACLLIGFTAAAQENKNLEAKLLANKNADQVLTRLIEYYNNDQFSEIHQLLSPDFKQHTTEQATVNFYQRTLKKSLGKITSWKYHGLTAGKPHGADTVYNYSTTFKSIQLAVDIMLTADQHISYINWHPFVEKKAASIMRDPASIKSNNPDRTKLQRYADTLARIYLSDPGNSSLSIGLVNGDSTETFFYGETKKGTGLLPEKSTLYEIGSISKTFTAIMVAHAVNEGKIKLDDDIRKYLPGTFPDLEFKGIPIKIVNLCNHTSGLPSIPDDFEKQPDYNAADPYLHYSKEMIYGYLRSFKPDASPGTESSYSNLGFGVLGTILENVYGKPLEKLVEQTITKPLKMYHTKYEVSLTEQKLMAIGYSDQTGKAVPYWNLAAFKAAGGLKADLNDMLLYVKANIKANLKANVKTNLTSKNKDFLLTYQVTDHQEDFERGLAWMIQPLKNEQDLKNGTLKNPKVIWHNGGTAGFRSFCGFIKDGQQGIVILSNSSAGVDNIALKLLGYAEEEGF